MKTALTITGSNSSGDASIQADIKTMIAHGVYAMSTITALTTQSTTGVAGIMEVTPSFLKEQLDGIFMDIFPDAVKIGMASSGGLIEAIGDRLVFYRAVNVMVDPVMVSISGSRFISEEATEVLKEVPPSMASLLTPNILEVEVLSGMEIHNSGGTEKTARAIGESYGCAVFLKGGHQPNDANDLLYRYKELKWLNGRRIDNPNTHGVGCTLSSAIASNLAKGMDMDLVVERVKAHLSGALEAQLNLGKGSELMNHGSVIRGEYQGGTSMKEKMNMKERGTSVSANSLIWFGAGVSIAEILTGTYLASLGLGKGLAVIMLGHVIGCTLLFVAGLIGGHTR